MGSREAQILALEQDQAQEAVGLSQVATLTMSWTPSSQTVTSLISRMCQFDRQCKDRTVGISRMVGLSAQCMRCDVFTTALPC